MGQDSRFGESAVSRWTLVLIILVMVIAGQSTIVQTKFGPVRGFWSRSTKGRLTTSYLGVPYAEPPIGDLRFRSPQPWTRTWNVTYNATADGNMCLQPGHNGEVVGSEDCLYLNIFLPVLSEKRKITEKLPVFVFVHGGKYNFGSSDSQIWSPEHMMDQNVVLVTINYRLNIMGFFSTESKVAPGNYGLKDIVMALRWVQENIEMFHGDPNSVTLWGHSAGAGAVHILSFSKSTEGLFHKYIAMSGSIFATWNVNPKDWMRKTSLAAAEIVGCLPQGTKNRTLGEECPADLLEKPRCGGYDSSKDKHLCELDEKMLKCMRSLDAKTIGGVLEHFFIWKDNPCCPFGPVIEEESEEAVLTADPLTTIKNKEFRDLPCIFGVVRDEGLVKTLVVKDSLDELKDHYKEYILVLLENHNQPGKDEFLRAIEEFYFASNVSGICFDDLTRAVTDALLLWPVYRVARHQFPAMKSNTFFYFFTYEGTFSDSFSYGTPPIHRGISHGDEIKYLMPGFIGNKTLKGTEADATITNIMTKMWARFAATGVPEASETIPWPDYKHSHKYLVFGNGNQPEVTVNDTFLPVRMAFWIKLSNDTVEIEDEEPEYEAQLPPEDASDRSSAQDHNGLLIVLLILLIAQL